MRLLFLVYGLLILQKTVTWWIPSDWSHPQLVLPLCTYLGISRFSITNTLAVFLIGLVMDAATGVVIGPWAGGGLAAYIFSGLFARNINLPALNISKGKLSSQVVFIVVMFLSSMIAFAFFHGLQSADLGKFPEIRDLFIESFFSVAAGFFLLPIIRKFVEPRRKSRANVFTSIQSARPYS
jgi:cell shape-determining protein MreD